MPILILGGQGNLGCQLTKIMQADYDTVSWDREDIDALDFSILRAKIKELNPELIINCIAYNAVDKCEDQAEYGLAYRLNADLPARLADIALEIGAILIHYSTDYVFSGTETKKEFNETDTPNPINRYGESKFAGEREIEQRAKKGLKYYLIRTSKLFGPIGTSPQAKPSFFDIMTGLAAKNPELTVVNEELSCFTYTPDLAMATRRLWELGTPFGLYHLVNEGPCTWYEAAEELFHLCKIKADLRPVRSENLLRAARRPKFSVLQNTKSKKLRSWKAALKEYLENRV